MTFFPSERRYNMAQEAINLIKQAEEKARNIITDAESRALNIVSNAKAQAKKIKDDAASSFNDSFIKESESAKNDADNLILNNDKQSEELKKQLYDKFMSDENQTIRRVIEYVFFE